MGNKLTEDNIATLPQLSTEYMNNTKVMQCIIDDTSVVGATMKVATVTKDQVKQIAETKMQDLNAADVEAAMRMIEGTARSMGFVVEG